MRDLGGVVEDDIGGVVVGDIGGVVMRDLGGVVVDDIGGVVVDDIGGVVVRDMGGVVVGDIGAVLVGDTGRVVFRTCINVQPCTVSITVQYVTKFNNTIFCRFRPCRFLSQFFGRKKRPLRGIPV